MALAVDRNRRRGQAHLRHRSAADERVSGLHLHAVGRGLQRVDRGKISGDERRDQEAHQGRPLGDRRRHVGRARPEHARRRSPGAQHSRWQALVPEGVRRRRPHRLESRFVWLHLAVAANLQALRHGLLCHAKNLVERHQSVPLQALLVGVARWQQGAHLLPARLRQQQSESRAALARLHDCALLHAGSERHDGSLRHWRPRRRTHARCARRRQPLGKLRHGCAHHEVRHRTELSHGVRKQDRTRIAGVGLRLHRQGLHASAHAARGQGIDSDLEERTLL